MCCASPTACRRRCSLSAPVCPWSAWPKPAAKPKPVGCWSSTRNAWWRRPRASCFSTICCNSFCHRISHGFATRPDRHPVALEPQSSFGYIPGDHGHALRAVRAGAQCLGAEEHRGAELHSADVAVRGVLCGGLWAGDHLPEPLVGQGAGAVQQLHAGAGVDSGVVHYWGGGGSELEVVFWHWRPRLIGTTTLSSAGSTDCALHGALLFFVCAKKSKQKKAHPDIRVWPAARLPSLRRCSGGRHDGASLPLRSSLGLLTGNGVRVAWRIKNLCLGFFGPMHKLSGDTNRPFQEGERNRCVRG